jgi:hypothetical protein
MRTKGAWGSLTPSMAHEPGAPGAQPAPPHSEDVIQHGMHYPRGRGRTGPDRVDAGRYHGRWPRPCGRLSPGPLRSLVVGLLTSVVLLTVVPGTTGQGLEAAIEVSFNVDTLRLASGETGTVVLDVCNTADVPLYVNVDFSRVDAPGNCVGTLSEEMFLLVPGEVRRVLVTVESRAHLNQDPDISDFKIMISWGPNATENSWDRPKDGQWRHDFDIVDVQPAWADWLLPGLFVLIIAVVGVVLYLASRGRRRPVQAGCSEYPPVHQNRNV